MEPGPTVLAYLALLAVSVLAWLGVAIIAHEVAHGITARILGGRVYSVRIGAGPDLCSFRLLSWRWEVRAWPVVGFVRAFVGPGPLLRIRQIAFLGAGAAANLGLAVACVLALGALTEPGEEEAWLLIVGLTGFLANVAMAGEALVPRRTTNDSTPCVTDGHAILTWIVLTPDQLREARQGLERMELQVRAWSVLVDGDFPGARELFASDPTDDVFARGNRAIADWGLHGPEAALSEFRSMQAEVGDDPGRSTWIRTNLAFSAVETGNPAHLPEAEEASEAALAASPAHPSTRRVRGMVLVAGGRDEEGVELLRKSLRAEEPPHLRAITRGALAIAAARRGDERGAHRCLRKARRLWPAYPGLPRVEQAVAGALTGAHHPGAP